MTNPRGCARGGMVTSKIEPCIIRLRKTTYVSADGWMVNFMKYWVASLQWIFLKTCVLFAPLRWTETYTVPCEYGPAPALYSVVHAKPCPVRKRAHNARDWSPVLWASLGLEKHGGRCDLLDQRFNHVLLLFQTSVRRWHTKRFACSSFILLKLTDIVLENYTFKERWVWHVSNGE